MTARRAPADRIRVLARRVFRAGARADYDWARSLAASAVAEPLASMLALEAASATAENAPCVQTWLRVLGACRDMPSAVLMRESLALAVEARQFLSERIHASSDVDPTPREAFDLVRREVARIGLLAAARAVPR